MVGIISDMLEKIRCPFLSYKLTQNIFLFIFGFLLWKISNSHTNTNNRIMNLYVCGCTDLYQHIYIHIYTQI